MAHAKQTSSHDLPLDTEQVLREEAKAIYGDAASDLHGKSGTALYKALNNLGSVALCLSGGGIRSAAFALGLIQALAVNPRPVPDFAKTTAAGGTEGKPGPEASDRDRIFHAKWDQSILAQIHYLSTVSGGGYIGSWLSAGISRSSLREMTGSLVERTPLPEDEAPQIGWLRSYSNYLTPKLGLTSADTWTGIALYIRNLILNWFVFIPVLCAVMIVIKLALAAAFNYTEAGLRTVLVIAFIGAALQIWALRFALLHRPTRPVRPERRRALDAAADAREAATNGREAVSKHGHGFNERHQAAGRGVDQGRFVRNDLVPSVMAAAAFSLAFWPDVTDPLLELPLSALTLIGFVLGVILYAVSWLVAWPWPARDKDRSAGYWATDFARWSLAGGVYGAIIGLGIYFYTFDLNFFIGNIKVANETKNALLLFIYGVPWIITAQLTAEMVFVGLTSFQVDSDADREWFGRSTGWFTANAIAWFAVTFLVLVGADLVFSLFTKSDSLVGKSATGMGSLIAGVVSAVLGKSSSSPARKGSKGKSWTALILPVTTTIFLVALVIGISAAIDNLLMDHSFTQSALIGGPVAPEAPVLASDPTPEPFPSWQEDLAWLLIGLVAAIIVGWIASRNVNVNRFSLHALYRNRLIRAFLGATNPDRQPDSFTGFDEHDNPPMTALWEPERSPKRLFHVINMALNVVSSDRLAWQERKAESFTVTPLHAGAAYKKYRPSKDYADGISVGTAVAISGAAASPNMGYHSSPLVTLLLALFNVRLGWWLGNPGIEGNSTYKSEGPRTAFKPLLDEMFGQTTDKNPYVYLSDGGHFENLGLYEMVRRRCRFIIVSDAGCDPDFKFEDLGNAVRKIWLDLGVSISFIGLNAMRNRAKRNETSESLPPFHAVGKIDYRAADGADAAEGVILYIKPSFHRNQIRNVGVRNYAALNLDFPHQSTGDQFFSESQFESYRALGFEMMDSILKRVLTKVPADAGAAGIFDFLPQTAAPGP